MFTTSPIFFFNFWRKRSKNFKIYQRNIPKYQPIQSNRGKVAIFRWCPLSTRFNLWQNTSKIFLQILNDSDSKNRCILGIYINMRAKTEKKFGFVARAYTSIDSIWVALSEFLSFGKLWRGLNHYYTDFLLMLLCLHSHWMYAISIALKELTWGKNYCDTNKVSVQNFLGRLYTSRRDSVDGIQISLVSKFKDLKKLVINFITILFGC